MVGKSDATDQCHARLPSTSNSVSTDLDMFVSGRLEGVTFFESFLLLMGEIRVDVTGDPRARRWKCGNEH